MKSSPHVSVIRRDNCRLCGGRELELVVPLAPSPVAEKYVTREQLDEPTEVYGLDLYMCRDCSHVQMLDVVDPDFLWDGFTYKSGQTQGIVDHLETCSEKICSRYEPATGELIVDIGSNDGTLLRAFQRRGLRVLGVDPAREIARQANESGLETVIDYLTPAVAGQIRRKHGAAKVVTAFNIFAHVDDLAEMTDSIRHLLAPDGVFIFEVSYLLDIVEKMLLGTIFHEHLSYHSVTPMDTFLKRQGLGLIDVERVTIQGGSLVGAVQLANGPYTATPAVDALLQLEKQRGLDRVDTMKAFSERLDRLRRQVADLMAELRRQGKTIAGYGAARSGTTLIAQMDLGNVIGCIFDDHPQKVHRYSPGSHIPVLPTAELLLRKPDFCFVLAWIHAKKIIASNLRYLEQGGRFIVCCPELRVIDLKEALNQ